MSATKKNIQLQREASERVLQAEKARAELKDRLTRQASGELEEGETKLSPDEINEKLSEVDQLVSEAKGIERLDSLEGFASRHEDANPNAQRILDAQKGVEPTESQYGSVGEFLRAVRQKLGNFDQARKLSEDQERELKTMFWAATQVERGEAFDVKELDPQEIKTLVGDDTGSDGRGDFLVPDEHAAELLRTMGESQQFIPRARQVPMNRSTIVFPRLKQTDAADTRPMFSFAAITKVAQGVQADEREPTFEQFTMTAVKYIAYLEAADELLADSIVNPRPVLVELLTGAIAYEYDRDGFRGSGSSEPQGFIGSSAELAHNRKTANTIDIDDVFQMESKFFGDNGAWFYHPSGIPDLYGLNASNVIVWNPNLVNGAPGTLLGRPLVRTAKLPVLGTKGDLCLVDPSFYLAGQVAAISVQVSEHHKFRNDVLAWRAKFRGAGSPWPGGVFSHESDGSNKTHEISPFVTLDVPAAS